MSRTCSSIAFLVVALLGPALWSTPLTAQVAVSEWLVLGPMPAPAASIEGDATLADNMLSFQGRWPMAGDPVSWFDGRSYRWERQRAQEGTLRLNRRDRSVAFALVYLSTDRWQKAKIELNGDGERHAWLDGKPVTGEVSLTQGSHWLLIQTQPPEDGEWGVRAELDVVTDNANVAASIDPRRAPTLTELERLSTVTSVKADPVGRRAAFMIRRVDVENDRWVSNIEIRELETGAVTHELGLGSQAMNPVWSRDGARLAFATPTDKQGGSGLDVWVWEPEGTGATRVLRSEPGVASLQWSADGSWLYFTGTVKPDSGKNAITGAARLTEVWHRWSFWFDKAQLYALHVDQGTRVTLAGDAEYSVAGPRLSPDGKRFVYTRDVQVPERPFVRSEIWLLDVQTLESRVLLELANQAFWGPTSYAWSPDGRAVAFCGSAKNTLESEDPEFSVFEVELYGTPIDRPRLVHLSEGFVPNLGFPGCTPTWNEEDGRIYIVAQDGARGIPVRTSSRVDASLSNVSLETMSLPAGETMSAHDIAGGLLVGAVESPVTPQTIYRMDLTTGEADRVFDPTDNALSQARMPEWQEWSFTNAKGWEIEGWYLTPSAFVASDRYPMIVFYYGGTAATMKRFDSRLASYAAQGYVVYVLNPAGAPGYGQEFSDMHIDDWGYPAGSDIIEGVTAFAEAHPFVDASRIGNFGHSYGGFMTMHLLTRTDLFAASASIAGISNIAGYWGAGWTGYSYTDGTCPGCYPWNRRDLYVDRSPLFQADKIATPLLLIHGTEDTNVVPTESEQMFTALRVLGKETELIRFFNENHGVSSKPSVQHNRDIMMFEWFDRYLRDRPDAWWSRWGESGEAKKVETSLPAGDSRFARI